MNNHSNTTAIAGNTLFSANHALQLKQWSKYLAGIVLLTGLAVLTGWQFDIELLRKPVPNLVAMNPITAALFVLTVISFFCLTVSDGLFRNESIGKIIALVIIGVGLLRLISEIFHLNILVDTIFFNEQLKADEDKNIPSRMAGGTALNFVLTGIALFFLKAERGKIITVQLIAVLMGLMGMLFIIGYLYQVNTLYGAVIYFPMAVHTAICFVIMAVAFLFATPDKGIMKELTSPFGGRVLAVFLIPAAIVIPVTLGFIRLLASWHGYLTLELGVALLVISIVIIFLILIWFIIVLFNKRGIARHRAENILRESEGQVQTIFSAAPDPLIVMDEEGKIVKWNRRAELLLGWKEDEVSGKLLSNIIIPERFRQVHINGLKKFLTTGEGPILGKTIETVALTKNGTEIDVALNISATPLANGKFLFIGFVRDLAGPKKAEEKFRALLDAAPDAMIIANANGKITLINKQTEILFGYERGELIDKPVEVLVPLDFRNRHQAHRNQYFTEPRVRSMGAGLELFAMRKDGTQFPVEISLSPLQTEEGLLVSASIRDITDRKKQEEKFRSLLNAAPDATVIVNEQGKIEMINTQTESLFEYKRDELIGMPVEILMPAELKDKHVHHRGDFMKAARTRTMGAGIELQAVKKSGVRFPVEISLSPLHTEQGMLITASVRDISMRKELQDELKKSTSEMEAFTYSVSHDLRAPLRGIIGFTAILEEDYAGKLDDEAKRITSVIKSNTLKMGYLIDDLLTFSRMGKQEIIRTQLDTMTMVREVIAELTQQDNIAIKAEWNISQLPAVKADMKTLRQVWINLISNAIKYSGKKDQPRIEINSYLKDGQVVFYIKDNGVGFDEQYKNKLFKVFQRLHSPDEFEGTGVGLALVERIISRHGGKVWAEGKQNEGASFYFSLPA